MNGMKVINNHLITIGIPSYNRPLTLKRTLDSIINQTYINLEILISDNCSTDAEVDILINDYCRKDSRISFVKQEKNLGASGNFYYLLKNATGKYFMWLADDDFISNDYIEEIMKEYDKDEGYSLIGGQGYFINSEKGYKTKNEEFNLLDESPSRRFLEYLRINTTNSIFYGVFCPKSLAMEYDMHFYGSDWLHVARLAYRGKVKTLKNISICREDNGVSNQHYSYYERVKIYYNIYKSFKRDLLNSELYKGLNYKELDKLVKDAKKEILSRISIVNILKKRLFKTRG